MIGNIICDVIRFTGCVKFWDDPDASQSGSFDDLLNILGCVDVGHWVVGTLGTETRVSSDESAHVDLGC